MKRVLFALAAAAALTAGSVGAANAFELGIGPGGVHVGPGWHRHYYDYEGGCRMIVTHRINPDGDRVTVRRRVCD
jgi:hypothetical protein